jgi:hypothetical protein
MSFLGLRRLCLGLFFGSVAASVCSAELLRDSRLSGFATLGLVSSDNSEIAFRRDITQDTGSLDGSLEWRTDSLIGLQWYGSLSAKVDATVQIVARDRFENSLEKSVEWAFIRYRPSDSVDVRLGRLGTDIFLLSDYRQVGYAMPWVRPPQDFYGWLSLYHIDGADINKRFSIGDGTANIKAFYGVSDERYSGSSKSNGGVDLKFESAGIRVSHEVDEWLWRYTFARVEMQDNVAKPLTDALDAVSPLWPDAATISEQLNTEGKPLIYHALGMTYDNNVWWARAEGASLSNDADLSSGGRFFYLSLGRRFGDVTVFGTRGLARSASALPDYRAPQGYPSPLAEQLNMLAYASSGAVEAGRQDQDSFGVGMRWDFRTKMALKLQVDRYDIDKSGASLWTREGVERLTEDQAANVVSFSLDILF